MKARKLHALGIFAVVTAAVAAPNYVTEGKRWWSHIQVLADDKLEGRNTGSEGYRKAATYVAGEFERDGLKPAGTNGYLQPMKFNVNQIEEDQSSLALVRNGKVEPLQLGEDANISSRSHSTEHLDAPLVFVGHGLVVPESHYDDLAGLDLKGKIAVFITGGPNSIPGPLKAHYSSAGERWKALEKAGVVGIASIPNPKSMDIPWSRSTLARLQPSMVLSEAALQDAPNMKFAMVVNPAHADKLFAGTGHTFAELLALTDASKPLPHFPLGCSVRAKVAIKQSQVESPNVVGLRPGSDPKFKDEYVVLSAHLDHVGVGQRINGDRIYNGAMDDASGIASLIEIARYMKDQNPPLKRSVIFIAVTGEEKGELGSKFFAAHPTVPAKDIVADINMDMFLPLFPLKYLEVQGLAESTLGDDIRAVCAKYNVGVQADKEPNRNLFIRSDQYSFIKQGVPALAFKFGYTAGSAEEKTAKEWLKTRYHAPSDDLGQPVDTAAAAEFDHIILDLAEKVADTPERPRWNQESFFRRFAH